MRPIVSISVVLLAVYAAFGQSAAAPSFDVASVKAVADGRGGRGFGPMGHGFGNQIQAEPGALTMRNVSMRAAIHWAYDIPEFQVSGPAWLASERFDISAKAAGAAPEDRLRLMLRSLLADRFRLAVHAEQKVMPYFLLTVAKGGPKFKESESPGETEMSVSPNNGSALLRRVPMAQLVDMLQPIFQAPVVDQTGLKGRYDATLNVGALISTPIQNDDITGTVITAVQDLLGLKLEPKKGPIDVLIVDHAEKVPTEN